MAKHRDGYELYAHGNRTAIIPSKSIEKYLEYINKYSQISKGKARTCNCPL